MHFNFKKTFSTPFFDIEEAVDKNYFGAHPYYRLTGQDSVICCVMTMQEEFVMVRQFRPNINEYSLEFPAGALYKNELPIKADIVGKTLQLNSFGHVKLLGPEPLALEIKQQNDG